LLEKIIEQSIQNNDSFTLNEVCFILSNLACTSNVLPNILNSNIVDYLIQEVIQAHISNPVCIIIIII